MKRVRIRHPESKLLTILHLDNPVEAELIRNTLLEHEIQCSLGGEGQAGFTGVFEIDLIVREEDVEAAEDILAIHHPHLFGIDSEPPTDQP